MRISLVSLAGLLALCFPLTACDDGVADSTLEPTFEPTSVPESKPIDELDETEQQDFCEEAAAWAEDILYDDLPTLLCNTQAIGASADQAGGVDLATCQAEREACLNDSEFSEAFDQQNLECNFEDVESCGATVGEFSDCFEEAADLLERSARELTCERIAEGYVPDESDFVISAQCEALFERCGGEAVDEGGQDVPPPPPE